MKRFSELNTVIKEPELADIPVSNQQPQIQPSSTNVNTEEIIESQTPFPAYMINDSSFVGYESEFQQYTLYRAAEFGTIVTGIENVLDVGAGRGDFGHYLLARYPNVKYTGLDFNQIMVQIGQYKYSEKYSTFRFNLQEAIFNNSITIGQKYDYVYNINNMSIDYGLWPDVYSGENRYEYLKMMIQKSMDLCNVGVVFMLHNDGSESSGQLTYSLTPVSNILYDMNLKFAIDNTDVPDMYKLVILKNSF
jgi:SAM-dependent methyltransferase